MAEIIQITNTSATVVFPLAISAAEVGGETRENCDKTHDGRIHIPTDIGNLVALIRL